MHEPLSGTIGFSEGYQIMLLAPYKEINSNKMRYCLAILSKLRHFTLNQLTLAFLPKGSLLCANS